MGMSGKDQGEPFYPEPKGAYYEPKGAYPDPNGGQIPSPDLDIIRRITIAVRNMEDDKALVWIRKVRASVQNICNALEADLKDKLAKANKSFRAYAIHCHCGLEFRGPDAQVLSALMDVHIKHGHPDQVGTGGITASVIEVPPAPWHTPKYD